MKRLLIFALILLTLPVFAVTNTTSAAGNLSDTTKWSQSHMPVSGEDVVFAHAITWDAGAGTRFPATGDLGAVSSTTGTLTVAVDTIGSCELHAVTISAGAATCIVASGSAPNTFGVWGNLTGGTAWACYGVHLAGWGPQLTVVGSVTGGSYITGYGIYTNNDICDITITGNVLAGTSRGILLEDYRGSCVVNGTCTGSTVAGILLYGTIGGASLTITGGLFGSSSTANSTGYGLQATTGSGNTWSLVCPSITNSATATAFAGTPPVAWTNSGGADELAKFMTFMGSTDIYVAALLDHEMVSGTVRGAITGNRADATATSVLSSHRYGPSDNQTTGTYHPTTTSEVLDTVSFGAGSAETGLWHAPLAAEVLSTAVFGVSSGTAGTWQAAANADVWYNVANGVSPSVGTKRASSIANCSAGNIKDGITIDDVLGTLTSGIVMVED